MKIRVSNPVEKRAENENQKGAVSGAEKVMDMYRLVLLAILITVLASCENSEFVDSDVCLNDEACPSGEACVDGACAPEGDEPPDKNPKPGEYDGDAPPEWECEQDSDCEADYVCDEHFCLPPQLVETDGDEISDGDLPDGDPGLDGDIEYDGDGLDVDREDLSCKSNADCNDGRFCNGMESCGDDGICIPGLDPCDDGFDCTDNRCLEGTAECEYDPDDAACNDGETCNGLEICDRQAGCMAGTPLNCDDGIDCTEDSCLPHNGCVHEAQHNRCDDSIDCTENICDPDMQGCVFLPSDSLCNDGFACTHETCLANQGCRIVADDVLCNDGISCTYDRCLLSVGCENDPMHGLCAPDELCDMELPGADSESGCAPRPACDVDEDCSDGLFCNGEERCFERQCTPGQAVNCKDGVACTEDRCDEDLNTCANVPIDSFCSDSDMCNGFEYCDPLNDCAPGDLLNCDDAVDCTLDRCDPATGCINEAMDIGCHDGVDCTVDICDPSDGCLHLPNNALCDDFVPCTINVCDTLSDCAYLPDNDYCNDGLACTTESCSLQYNCVYETHDDQCDDGIACTGDICEVGSGCRHPPNDQLCPGDDLCDNVLGCVEPPECLVDADCSDDDVCTGAERCSNQKCTNGPPLDCNDLVSCTVDSCDPYSGCANLVDHLRCDDFIPCTGNVCHQNEGCQYPPNDSLCGDAVGCTEDICDSVEGCLHLEQDDRCDDQVGCTVDTCDEVDDCVFAPNHDACAQGKICDPIQGCRTPECFEDEDCSDGSFCNGAELCINNTCYNGDSVNCDDGIACTEDHCDTGAQQCVNAPLDSRCADYTVCNGHEECNAESGCQLGQALDCDDQLDCTTDSCDSAMGCQNNPVHGMCDDGTACTTDTCELNQGCVFTPDDDACDDLVPCSIDTCNPVGGCEYETDDEYCDDDIACTSEICSLDLNCVYTTHDELCQDAVSCTMDVCENYVGCRQIPDDSNCQAGYICDPVQDCLLPPDCDTNADCLDNDVCNGAEQCSGGYCSNGNPLNCDDLVSCTMDFCLPATGCGHNADDNACPGEEFCDTVQGCIDAECQVDADCTDNDYCNGIERCIGGFCQDGSLPDCNGGLAANDLVQCVPATGCVYDCRDNYYDCNGDLGNSGNGCERYVRSLFRGIDSQTSDNSCSSGKDEWNNYSGACSSARETPGPEVIFQWKADIAGEISVLNEPEGYDNDIDLFMITDPCLNTCIDYSARGSYESTGYDRIDFTASYGATYFFVSDGAEYDYYDDFFGWWETCDDCGDYRIGLDTKAAVDQWLEDQGCETTGGVHAKTFILIILVLLGWWVWLCRMRKRSVGEW